MSTASSTGVKRRLASFLLAACALFGAASAQAVVSVDTRPSPARAGDYVTLEISGSFPRPDYWITEAVLTDLRPAVSGSTTEFIAEVDLYYRWVPWSDNSLRRTPFSASVGLGQFERSATVDVQIRFFPMYGLPYSEDVPLRESGTVMIGGGAAACGNVLELGASRPCTPTLRFGSYRAGERSDEFPVVIRNNSKTPFYFGIFELNNADYGMTRRCGESLEPGVACEILVSFSPSIDGTSPGRINIRYAANPDAIPFENATVLLTADSRRGEVQGPTSGARVVEYHAQSVDQYFLTANENEMRLLDGNANLGWRRTGVTFLAAGGFVVCRFYGDPVGGPNGHFYTARVDVCDALRSRDTLTPRGQNVYRFEGLAFDIGLPLSPLNDDRWRCPDGSRAIYQFRRPAGQGKQLGYRLVPAGSVQGAPNGDDIARTMLNSGWSYEGHVMCSMAPAPEEAQ